MADELAAAGAVGAEYHQHGGAPVWIVLGMGAGCFLGFQVAFKRCFRGSVLNGVAVARFSPLPRKRGLGGYFSAAGVLRSHSLNVQAAFDVSGSLHFGFWGAGCFQVAFGRLVRI